MVGINHFLGRGDRMRGRNGGFGPPAEASSVLIVGEGRGGLMVFVALLQISPALY